MYAQVKANIDKLDKKGKQRILQLLQKSMAAPAATPAAGAAPAATSAPAPAPEEPAASGAMGAMAQQLGATKPAAEPANTMANAPVSKTNVAKPGNPNAAPVAAPEEPAAAPPKKTGGRVKGQLSQDPRAVKRREANAAKTKQQAQTPDQATIDAERDKIMGVTSDSIVRRQPMMAEGFSLFRKRT
jgi:hypothetical protein